MRLVGLVTECWWGVTVRTMNDSEGAELQKRLLSMNDGFSNGHRDGPQSLVLPSMYSLAPCWDPKPHPVGSELYIPGLKEWQLLRWVYHDAASLLLLRFSNFSLDARLQAGSAELMRTVLHNKIHVDILLIVKKEEGNFVANSFYRMRAWRRQISKNKSKILSL